MMFTVKDESLLLDFERAEAENPSPTKMLDEGRIIYGSRSLGLPKGDLWGDPTLCDFGEARIGERNRGPIQPELYRAPEVLFDMGWSSSVDIWSIAPLIWDLFENKHLFHALHEDGGSSATHHIAEMVGFLGVPPLEYIQRSEVTKNVFDEQGQWKNAGGVKIPRPTLEESEVALDGAAKAQFLDFVRSMLRWLPEERLRATALLKHPWMDGAIS